MPGKTLAVIPLATADSRLVTVAIQDGAVDGIAKIVQGVIFLLGTDKGSVRQLPALGASPAKQLRGMSMADQSQIQDILNEASSEIIKQLEWFFPAAERETEEQIRSVSLELNEYDAANSTVFATLLIETSNGQAANYPMAFKHSI